MAHSKYNADIRYIAYDRSKDSEVHERQIDSDVYVLDRSGLALKASNVPQ